MVNERTPILLAFGRHGKKRRDRQFFRETVGSFIDDVVEPEERPAAIIYEYLLPYVLANGPRNLDEARTLLSQEGSERTKTERRIAQETTKAYRDISELVHAHLDVGGFSRSKLFRWGFEDHIQRLNGQRHKRVLNFIEPQDAQTMYGLWESELEFNRMNYFITQNHGSQVQAVIDYTKKLIEVQTRRDAKVRDFALKLRKEDPRRAIIIPRGTGHRGMHVLFDSASFDVRYESADYALDFADELLARSYTHMPSDEELRLCAERQVKFVTAYNSKATGPVNIFLRLTGFSDLAEKRIQKFARAYALSE